jgi:hypothetical protein
LEIGDKVKLVKFNGKTKSQKTSDNSEAYWKLIGETGIVQQDPQEGNIYAHFSERPRVLVKFNTDLLASYGLTTHNNINNSLWILVSDLEIINQE